MSILIDQATFSDLASHVACNDELNGSDDSPDTKNVLDAIQMHFVHGIGLQELSDSSAIDIEILKKTTQSIKDEIQRRRQNEYQKKAEQNKSYLLDEIRNFYFPSHFEQKA